MSDEWVDVPSVNSSDGDWVDVTETPRKSYNVDLKSKEALNQNQIEMVKRNPDFQSMSKLEQARLIGSMGVDALPQNSLLEIPRFAADTGLAIANAGRKVGKDVLTLGRAARGLFPGETFEDSINAAADMQKNDKPWQGLGLFDPSATGELIGQGFQAGQQGLASLGGMAGEVINGETGKQVGTDLANQASGVALNTMMFSPLAKGIMKKTLPFENAKDNMEQSSGVGTDFTEPSPMSDFLSGIKKFGETVSDIVKSPEEKIKSANQRIREGVARIFKPEKKPRSPDAAEGIRNLGEQVVDDIHEWSKDPNTSFVDGKGEQVADRAPYTRGELAQVMQDRMKTIYDSYSGEMKRAGNGNISVQKYIDQFTDNAAEWENSFAHQDLVPKVEKMIQLLKDQEARGGVDLTKIDETLRKLNDMKPSNVNMGPDSIPKDIIDPLIEGLREDANNAIETSLGSSSWLKERQLYSAYRKFVKNATTEATKQLAEKTKGDIRVLDSIAALEGIGGLMSLNPKLLAGAAMTEGFSKWRKYVNSPDTAIKNLFKEASYKDRLRERMKPVEGEYISPNQQGTNQSGGPITDAELDPMKRIGLDREAVPQSPIEPLKNGELDLRSGQPVEPAQITHEVDARATWDHAWEKWQEAEKSGDQGEASFWRGKAEDAVRYTTKLMGDQKAAELLKKVGIPAAAITVYLAADDEGKKRLLGLPMFAGLMSSPKFTSKLKDSLGEIVPEGKSLVATPDVKLGGSVEKRFMTPQGEKIIPAIEGKTVPGKPVSQLFTELAKKLNVTDAELRASGVTDALKGITQIVNRELKPGETGTMTVKQLSDIIESKLPKLGEDVYGQQTVNKTKPNELEGKPAQFPSYQAIKDGDVIPGSYTEKFVTADMPSSPNWKDEHSQYTDTKNPMIRLRYDDVTKPDGRKVRRLQEIQEPKQVNIDSKSAEARAKSQYESDNKGSKWEDLDKPAQATMVSAFNNIVPHDLATRAMDMGIKQLIADAKRDGIDGIEWSTGEQQRDLYNSALRQVADEARWNPETQELTVYKNGSVSPAQSQIPKVVTKEMLPEFIGKTGTERLLASEVKNTYKIKLNPEETDYAGDNRYDVVKKGSNRVYYTGDELGAKEWIKRDSPSDNQHIATDLSIDATWPGKLYGDFAKNTVTKTLPKLTEKDPSFVGLEEGDLPKEDRIYFPEEQLDDEGIGYVHYDSVAKRYRVLDASENVIGSYDNLQDATRGLFESGINATKSKGSGDFNYSATVPRLLKKYGKGEFGVSKPKATLREPLPTELRVFKSNDIFGELVLLDKETGHMIVKDDTGYNVLNRNYEYMDEGTTLELAKKAIAELNNDPQQPIMWLTKDTPSKFNIYTHPATALFGAAIAKHLLSKDKEQQ